MNKTHRKIPAFAERIIRNILPDNDTVYLNGDIEELYNIQYSSRGNLFANIWLAGEICKSIPNFVKESYIGKIAMFKNYLKITLRTLLKSKSYSFINIFGLAAGFTCCIFILLQVNFELSYDNYHNDPDRIYRVVRDSKAAAGTHHSAHNYVMIGPAIKQDFPQVEFAGRYRKDETLFITYNNQSHKIDRIGYVETELFKILNVDFISGNPETSLSEPNKVVIVESLAEKLFGRESHTGKMIDIAGTEFEVTGIIKDSPDNTHFKFGIIISWKTLESNSEIQGWDTPMHVNCYTYIKLKPGVDDEEFESMISRLEHKYGDEALKSRGVESFNIMQPIQDIHLRSHRRYELEPSGNPLYVYLFSGIGIFIFLIACMNFINLSTARSASRSCEVGMRKVTGALRSQIIAQYLIESVLISCFALIISIGIVVLFLNAINNIADSQFSLNNLLQTDIALSILFMTLFTGLAAGSYPAFFLSDFKPIKALKGTAVSGTKGTLMRKTLVIGQFAVSVILIITTLIVYQQLNYMKDQPLGFSKEQKMVVSFPEESMINNYETVKSEFMKHSSIREASASYSIPGRYMIYWWIWPTGREDDYKRAMYCLPVDFDFLSVYDIELETGRDFDKEMGQSGFILNSEAVKEFGWDSPEEAIGKGLWGRDQVIGVIESFHFTGLQNDIGPMVLFIAPDFFEKITLTVDTDELTETISFVEEKFKVLYPGVPFEYLFLDEDFDRQYRSEERAVRVFIYFTFLGIFIACLGLFGLAAYMTEKRTKEIGIRKVVGAETLNIIRLLTGEFIKWVIISNMIALPCALIASNFWLSNFAYRADIGSMTFIVAGLMSIFVAAVTVIFQVARAARMNPVDSLRYE
ncbi:MAG: FtsX-like permease family protein [bacterium]|nr:FtsX-like permease family protein [bacterium]